MGLLLLVHIPAVSCTSLKEYRLNNGLVILPSVFPPSDFKLIRELSKDLCKNSLRKETNSLARGRLGSRIAKESKLHELFTDGSILSRIERVTGRGENRLVAPRDFPLEIRKYVKGAHMPFHYDEQLYKKPQIEFVYTVENSSDSYTCWVDARGETQKVRTEPNSMICIQAATVSHAVTPLKRGERVIIKGLAIDEGVGILDEKAFKEALQTYL
jgi:hypothetical protein